MSPRLLFFADACAEHTLRWTRYFAEEGLETHLITWNIDHGSGSYRDTEVWRKKFEPVILHELPIPGREAAFPLKVAGKFLGLWRIFWCGHSIAPDIVHGHSLGSYGWVTMLFPWTRRILTPWGTDITHDIKNSAVVRALTTAALRRADLVTTDGAHCVPILTELGVAEDRISHINFGTDTKIFAPQANVRLRYRNKFGFDETHRVFIQTRTLTPIHDVETFVRAGLKLCKEKRGTRFLVCSDGLLRKNLEELVQEAGQKDSFVFPGYLTQEDMIGLLNAADVYVSTSKSDAGLAASTAEAMAVGLPVVSTDNADNQSWLERERGQKNQLFLARDVDACAVAMANALDCSDDGGGEANRAVIERDLSYDREMKKMLVLYKNLAGAVLDSRDQGTQ